MSDDSISRQAAITAVLELDVSNRVSWKDAVIDTLDALPPAQPRQTCEYWDSESNFCALCRPSAQPERKKGHWTEKEVMYIKDAKNAIDAWQSCKCSECGRYDTRPYMYFFVEPMFCSYCGAEMKKGESDGENRSN